MNEAYKQNVIEIAKHHRKYCEGEECTVSLLMLMKMAEALGISFTKEEFKLFI